MTHDLQELSRRLVKEGKLIEAGWIGLRIAAIPPDATEIQLTEMRMAFFAGAHHLLYSVMTVLDAGAEPTEIDLQRMDKIDGELKAFIQDFTKRIKRNTKSSA